MTAKQRLFFAPKNKKLAGVISIKNPTRFKKSITTLKKNGLTVKEKRALVLARNRAGAQLKRKNLSMKERKQFTKIVNTRIPNVSSKARRGKRKR